jgi:hypothetical protein
MKPFPTGHYSQFGSMENFLLNDILGIKKYLLLQAAEPTAGRRRNTAGNIFTAYFNSANSFINWLTVGTKTFALCLTGRNFGKTIFTDTNEQFSPANKNK